LLDARERYDKLGAVAPHAIHLAYQHSQRLDALCARIAELEAIIGTAALEIDA
jgi:hypothetical protein